MIVFRIIFCLYMCIIYTNGEAAFRWNFDDETPPLILKRNTKVEATLGASVSLTCRVIEGDEPITIYWEFVSSATQELKSFDDVGPKLTITSVERGDAGKYTCIAENKFGDDEHTVELKIKGEYSGPPKIDKGQKVLVTGIGKQLDFSCKLLEGSSNTKIRWTFKSRQSNYFKRIRPNFANDPDIRNKVFIQSVTNRDLGLYKCIAVNNMGQDEHIFEVTTEGAAAESPVIDKTITTVQAKVGYPTALNCKIIGGDPKPTIKWEYKRSVGDKYIAMLETEGETHMIDSVTIQDAGFYKCIAGNVEGSDSHVIQLTLPAATEPPVMDKTVDIHGVKYGPLVLSCNIIGGDPPTKIRWEHKSNLLDDNFETLESENETLIIDKNFGMGFYTCTAENAAGLDSHTIHVYNPDDFRARPEIDGTIKEVQATKGHPAALNCRIVGGSPAKTIKWHYKIIIEDHEDYEENLKTEGPTLLFDSVTDRDAGVYTCTARSHAGNAAFHSIRLILPGIKAPTTNYSPEVVQAAEGHPITIKCKVGGGQPRTIRWSFQNQVKSNAIKTLKTEGEALLINPVTINDVGFYGCAAINVAGFGIHVTMLTLQTAPGSPVIDKTFSKVTAREGNPAALNCKIIRGDPATTIKWQYRQDDSSVVDFKNLNKYEGETMVIKNTQKRRNQGIYRCIAKNAAGYDLHYMNLNVEGAATAGSPVINKTIQTVVAKVDDPAELNCKIIDGDSVTIHWEYAADLGYHFEHHRMNLNTEGDTFSIDSVLHQDKGIYICTASNTVGSDSHIMHLYVQGDE